MKLWRSSKRHSTNRQPQLPGLFASPADKPNIRRLATPGEHALELAKSRLSFLAILFSLAYLVIGGRLTDLTLFSEPPEYINSKASNNETPITSRADLTDRNGTILATSLPTVSVCANPKKMIALDDAADKLMSVLPDLDKNKLQNELRSAKHCVVIKRHLTPRQSYAVNRLGIAGLEYIPDERRIYPAGNVTAHILGYTNIDNQGLSGAEKSLDARLQESPTPVALSLDLRLQTIMDREISDAITEFRALAGAGLIMDITNGEILSMVSLPDFDPHHPGTADNEAKFNRSTLGVYEMGSTFKIFNSALALDSGAVRVSDVFDTTHPIEIGHSFIHDFHPENHPLNVVEIFTHSSNIGSARMVQRVGGVRQRAFLAKLGLTEKLPLELPEVGAPLVPTASNWGEATTLTAAFGHGISVNMVQMAGAVGSIVNDGIKIHPTILKTTNTTPPSTERLVSSRTSQLLRAMMRLVVTHGTAKQADVNGYLVGGKTGTADKLSGKHYSENSRLSSFIGVFPINAPRYLVMVMLDDPKATAKTYGFATGGWTAAPVVGRVISQMGPLVGMTPQSPELAQAAEQQLLRQLGTEVLDRMQIDLGADYAADESTSEH